VFCLGIANFKYDCYFIDDDVDGFFVFGFLVVLVLGLFS
jgi:hypothetical protein